MSFEELEKLNSKISSASNPSSSQPSSSTQGERGEKIQAV
jgi:hypothetical protein